MGVVVWNVLSYLIISFLIPLIMIGISSVAGFKYNSFMSVFECGFDSYNVSLLPLSLRFFVFCIVFLILDLELIIMSFSTLIYYNLAVLIGLIVFFIILTLALVLDWELGGLSWLE